MASTNMLCVCGAVRVSAKEMETRWLCGIMTITDYGQKKKKKKNTSGVLASILDLLSTTAADIRY